MKEFFTNEWFKNVFPLNEQVGLREDCKNYCNAKLEREGCFVYAEKENASYWDIYKLPQFKYRALLVNIEEIDNP
jgi:hypothetical protein